MNLLATILLVLVVGLVNGQLNFEGNPLTENTEYTAVESRLFETVEVIYTKPPGFHRGPPIINNHPIPYEDAAWFPEVDHPPSSNKDIYYSQLYAQSYDPYYYNYIARIQETRFKKYYDTNVPLGNDSSRGHSNAHCARAEKILR